MGDNLSDVIEKFGTDNMQLARKSWKGGGAVVAQLVSNCESRSDRWGLILRALWTVFYFSIPASFP